MTRSPESSSDSEAGLLRLHPALDSLTRHPWFPRVVDAVGWVVVVGILYVTYKSFFAENLENALDPAIINGDARQQIPPFYPYFGTSHAFEGDYLTTYYYHSFPIGYRWLFEALAGFGVDPYLVGAYLPYPLSIATAGCLMVAANQLGGKPAALAVGCLWLGGGAFNQLGGGLPRAFAFPVVALGLMGLSLGRPRIAGFAAILGAAFYPMAGVLCGLSMFLWMLLPDGQRGQADAWSLRRRTIEVAVAGAISVIVLGPMLLGTGNYGHLVSAHDETVYPEAGPHGRNNPIDKPPFKPFMTESMFWVHRYLVAQPGQHPLLEQPAERLRRDKRESYEAVAGTIFAVSLFGWLLWFRKKPEVVRLSLMFASALILFLLARPLLPKLYLPPRYPKFGVPPLMMLICSVGGLGLLTLTRHTKLQQVVASVAICIVLLGTIASKGDPRAGLEIDLGQRVELLEFIGTLEEDSVIAGMPNGIVDNVPYVSRRAALLTREMHQAYHEKFIAETRERMYAFIDAYFGRDRDALEELHERYGVTHVLVRRSDFRGHPPGYHAPFGRRIRSVARRNKGKYVMLDLIKGPGVVYRGQGHIVVDLQVALGTQSG